MVLSGICLKLHMNDVLKRCYVSQRWTHAMLRCLAGAQTRLLQDFWWFSGKRCGLWFHRLPPAERESISQHSLMATVGPVGQTGCWWTFCGTCSWVHRLVWLAVLDKQPLMSLPAARTIPHQHSNPKGWGPRSTRTYLSRAARPLVTLSTAGVSIIPPNMTA